VSADLPPTLVLMAEAERFFPPILRGAAEFVGRALAAGAEADLAVLADRRHVTALQRMVTPEDPAVVRVADFIRAHE
jgi:acetyl esterase/lipase